MQESTYYDDPKYLESPRGGASINFGTNKILGQQPLSMHREATPVIKYLNEKGIHKLAQISNWDPLSHVWTGWSFPEIPNALEPSLSCLKTLLHLSKKMKRMAFIGIQQE